MQIKKFWKPYIYIFFFYELKVQKNSISAFITFELPVGIPNKSLNLAKALPKLTYIFLSCFSVQQKLFYVLCYPLIVVC